MTEETNTGIITFKRMDIPEKSETKSERLEREIAEFEKQLKFFEEVERSARNDQHWVKKRLKLAKEELSQLKESSETP